MIKYVDLGAKNAGALAAAIKRGPSRGLPRAKPEECMAVERVAAYRRPVEKRGFQFVSADVQMGFSWERADVYLAWNFLEHLNSIEAAQKVLTKMFAFSRQCVWLLLPSFEEAALKRLAKFGYTFKWVDWKCHRAHVQLKHVDEVAKHFQTRIEAKKVIKRWAVRNCANLKPLKGRKQIPADLEPPLPGALEVMYYLKES